LKCLIDTHIFLWLIFEPEKIKKEKLKILEDPQNTIYVSSISFWEISLKYSLSKLDLDDLKPDDLIELAQKMDIKIIDINTRDMASYFNLNKIAEHKDPFDRLLVWYCIRNGYSLVSCDSKFGEYAKFGLKLL